jgi:hypothetical protein
MFVSRFPFVLPSLLNWKNHEMILYFKWLEVKFD